MKPSPRVLFCWSIVLGIFSTITNSSNNRTNVQEHSGLANHPDQKYVLRTSDLEMETVSDWTAGRFVTMTGTVLNRFGRNFLKWTKIVISFDDQRCRGLIDTNLVENNGKYINFDIDKNLNFGILNLLNLIIIRANRKNDGRTNDIPNNLNKAKKSLEDFLKNPNKVMTFDMWKSLVYDPLTSLFSEDGMNLFGIRWRSELRETFQSVKNLIADAEKQIVMNRVARYIRMLRPLGGNKDTMVATLMKFAHNFAVVSDFAHISQEWINFDKEIEIIAEYFKRLINEGLLPHLERLIDGMTGKEADFTQEQVWIHRELQFTKHFIEQYLSGNPLVTEYTGFFQKLYYLLEDLFDYGNQVEDLIDNGNQVEDLIVNGNQVEDLIDNGNQVEDLIDNGNQVEDLIDNGNQVIGGTAGLPKEWADIVKDMYLVVHHADFENFVQWPNENLGNDDSNVDISQKRNQSLEQPSGSTVVLRIVETMGEHYVSDLRPVVPENKVETLKHFENNFWLVSDFVNREIFGKQQPEAFSKFFIQMVRQGLLPHLNSLIIEDYAQAREFFGFQYAINNRMKNARDWLVSYLPEQKLEKTIISPMTFSKWKKEIYGNLHALFKDARKVQAWKDLPKNWAKTVKDLFIKN